jgi:SAM-dependent methyltransferase
MTSSAAAFDAHVEEYERTVERAVAFAGKPHAFYLEAKAQRLLDLLARRLGDPGRLAVLDVGCGSGLLHPFILPRLGFLQGADPSPAAIEAARRGNPGARYEVLEGERLAQEDASFDAVVAVNVLHHVAPGRRQGLVGEMARVVRPGGLVVAFEHNPWHPLTRLVVSRCPFDRGAVLVGRLGLSRLFRAAGLEVVEARHLLLLPSAGTIPAALEAALAPFPLGAQHYVAGRSQQGSLLKL